jgi:hypothetical protein
MSFEKNCPICEEDFTSLVAYMTHIKNKHGKLPPEYFVRNSRELKWSFRNSV